MQTVQLLSCLLVAVLTIQAVRAQSDQCPPDVHTPACDYFNRWTRGRITPRPSRRDRRQLVSILKDIASKRKGEAVNRLEEQVRQGSRLLRERLNLRNILMGRTF